MGLGLTVLATALFTYIEAGPLGKELYIYIYTQIYIDTHVVTEM